MPKDKNFINFNASLADEVEQIAEMIEGGSFCRKRKAEDTKKRVAEVFKSRERGMRKRE